MTTERESTSRLKDATASSGATESSSLQPIVPARAETVFCLLALSVGNLLLSLAVAARDLNLTRPTIVDDPSTIHVRCAQPAPRPTPQPADPAPPASALAHTLSQVVKGWHPLLGTSSHAWQRWSGLGSQLPPPCSLSAARSAPK